MTEKPTTFPQHAARPPVKQQSIADILEAADGLAPAQTMALVRASFSKVTTAEFNRAYVEYADRLEFKAVKARIWANIVTMCAPVVESGEAPNYVEALRILVDQGDEKAAAHLAVIAAPVQQEFNRVLDLAVAEDPYWYRGKDGYGFKPGARYTTPDELVAAYRKNHGLE